MISGVNIGELVLDPNDPTIGNISQVNKRQFRPNEEHFFRLNLSLKHRYWYDLSFRQMSTVTLADDITNNIASTAFISDEFNDNSILSAGFGGDVLLCNGQSHYYEYNYTNTIADGFKLEFSACKSYTDAGDVNDKTKFKEDSRLWPDKANDVCTNGRVLIGGSCVESQLAIDYSNDQSFYINPYFYSQSLHIFMKDRFDSDFIGVDFIVRFYFHIIVFHSIQHHIYY